MPGSADELSAGIRDLKRSARAVLGEADVRLLRRLKGSTRIAEVIGRLCLQFAPGPVGWLAGVAALAYCLSVEAQLNHSIMHGAYEGLPGAGRFTRTRYETLAIPFQSKTWRDAHRIHHAHPSLLEKDPDTVHPLFRVHERSAFRAWHRFNIFLGALFTFECWAFDYDRFLKRTGHRPPSDGGERRKFLLYAGYQYLLFPLLAGPRFPQVLAAAMAATVIRNLIFTGLQTASSVGRNVSTRHALAPGKKRTAEWLRFQIETSKNFVMGGPFAWALRVICGGLDRHIEHHLFPALPPNRLHALSPQVKELCRQNGVRYEEHPGFASSLADSLGHLAELSVPP